MQTTFFGFNNLDNNRYNFILIKTLAAGTGYEIISHDRINQKNIMLRNALLLIKLQLQVSKPL
jgi:hypothetical protein